MSPRGLAERLDIPFSDAKDLFDRFFKAFPKFKIYFENNAKFALENLYISTGPPFYRKRFFEAPQNKADEGSIERQAKNAPIQGASADMLKLALVKLYDKLEEVNWVNDELIVHLPIHDEILASIDKNNVKLGSKLLEKSMLESSIEFLNESLVTADVVSSKVWEKN